MNKYESDQPLDSYYGIDLPKFPRSVDSTSRFNALVESAREGDELALDEAVCMNLRLVTYIIHNERLLGPRTSPSWDSAGQLGEGVIALIRSVKKFDPSMENCFSSYAYPSIVRSLREAIAARSRTVRYPEPFHQASGAVKSAEIEAGRELNDEELSSMAGVSIEMLQKVRLAEYMFADMLPIEAAESVPEDDDESEVGIYISFREAVAGLIDSKTSKGNSILTRIEKDVIRTRYGFDGEPKSYEEIGTILYPGRIVSKQRVHAIQESAFKKLRVHFSIDDFRDFLD